MHSQDNKKLCLNSGEIIKLSPASVLSDYSVFDCCGLALGFERFGDMFDDRGSRGAPGAKLLTDPLRLR